MMMYVILLFPSTRGLNDLTAYVQIFRVRGKTTGITETVFMHQSLTYRCVYPFTFTGLIDSSQRYVQNV